MIVVEEKIIYSFLDLKIYIYIFVSVYRSLNIEHVVGDNDVVTSLKKIL